MNTKTFRRLRFVTLILNLVRIAILLAVALLMLSHQVV